MTHHLAEAVPGIYVSSESSHPCSACGAIDGNRTLNLPGDPLRYHPDGTGAFSVVFPYTQCAACGSLSIEQIPDDLSPYYTGTYYSHAHWSTQGIRGRIQRLRDYGAVFARPLYARLLADFLPYPRLGQLRPLTKGSIGAPLTHRSAILDVGCGAGNWLFRLAALGFENLNGCDPFLHKSVIGPPVTLSKCYIDAVSGNYDLISSSHALEHVSDPLADLVAMRNLLTERGVIMLRLPLVNDYAWKTYGSNWVQLDAPRHLTLFSVDGVEALASRAGMRVALIEFDAFELMVLGSEARCKGLFPHGPKDAWQAEMMTAGRKIRHMARDTAVRTNADGTSDQATFFLVHS